MNLLDWIKDSSYPRPEKPVELQGRLWVVVGSMTYNGRIVVMLSEVVRDCTVSDLNIGDLSYRYTGQETLVSNLPSYVQLRLQGD